MFETESSFLTLETKVDKSVSPQGLSSSCSVAFGHVNPPQQIKFAQFLSMLASQPSLKLILDLTNSREMLILTSTIATG